MKSEKYNKIIGTQEASLYLGITQEHLRRLVRKGKGK